MTLWSGCAQQTIILFVLARNQTKGLESRSPTRPELGKGTPVRELKRGTHWKQLAKGDAVAVDNGQQKRPVGMREGPGAVREDQSIWVSIPRGFVEISRRMRISVSLQMHRKCSVTELPFLHLEFTQAHIVRLFFVLFLPLPRLYFLCCKEMRGTPGGPLDESPAKT